MKVSIHLDTQSQPMHRTVLNSYTKGGMYCIYIKSGKVEKYPLVNIFRVEEQYNES